MKKEAISIHTTSYISFDLTPGNRFVWPGHRLNGSRQDFLKKLVKRSKVYEISFYIFRIAKSVYY